MLYPGLLCGRPAITVANPSNTPLALPPAAMALQATVAPAPPHSVAPVATLQLASSSPPGASFVVTLTSRAATLGAPPAQLPSRPFVAAFQTKMVALAHSVSHLMSPAIEPVYPRSGAAPVGGGWGSGREDGGGGSLGA